MGILKALWGPSKEERHQDLVKALTAIAEMRSKGAILLQPMDKTKSAPIIMKNDEHIIKLQDFVTFAEEKAHRNFGGASVKVVKGVSIFVGQSHSVSRISSIDSGLLILTNMRICYFGKMRKIEIRIEDLCGMEGNEEIVNLYKSGREKLIQFQIDWGAPIFLKYIEYLLEDTWHFYQSPNGQRLLISESGQFASVLKGATKPKQKMQLDFKDIEVIAAYFLAKMVTIDGDVSADELQSVKTLIDSLTLIDNSRKEVLTDRFIDFIVSIKSGIEVPHLEQTIEKVCENLEPEGIEWILKACMLVAGADGKIDQKEHEFIEYLKRRFQRIK